MGENLSSQAGQPDVGLVRGGKAALKGKRSGWGGAALGPQPPPVSYWGPRPPPPSHAPALASPQALRAAGGRRWEIRGLAGVGPRGRWWGISPHACLGLLPLPRHVRVRGTAGGIPPRGNGSEEPGLGVLGKRGGGEKGTGWDQGSSCLPPQTPAASACPGISVYHFLLFRGCRGREWHFLHQSRGIRTCGRKGVRIPKRVCV